MGQAPGLRPRASGSTGGPPGGSFQLNPELRAIVTATDVPHPIRRPGAGSRIGEPTQISGENDDQIARTPENVARRETGLPPSRTPDPPRRRRRMSPSTSPEDDFEPDVDLQSTPGGVDTEKPRARQTKNSMRAGLPTLATGRNYPKAESRMHPGSAFFLGALPSKRAHAADDNTTHVEVEDHDGSDGSRRTRRRRA